MMIKQATRRGPAAAPLAGALRDAIMRLNRRMRQARPLGDLTLSQISALTSLGLAGALTPRELAEHEPGVVWICKQAAWPGVQARVVASGYRVEVLGAPYEGRVLFRVERAAQEPGIGTRERKPVIPARS